MMSILLPVTSRKAARNETRDHLIALLERMNDMRIQVDQSIEGLLKDQPWYADQYILALVCEEVAGELATLDGALWECEQTALRLYELIWTKL